MYKVKVDEKLLCFTGSVNGMEYVTDPDVKLVVNGVDSFSFAIYPQHPLYKKIVCKVSRVKIWRDSKLLFYGEVTGYSRDMYGIRTYDCEGALAWLNDLHFAYAISGATPKDVLYWYIKQYNQKLRDKSKSFELGTVTVHKAMTQDGTEGTIARSSGVYPSFWEEIQDKLLNSFGGILRVRYVGSDTCAGYIDWLAIPDGTCTQDVRYAKNLLNCDWTYDCTSIATAVVPLGKRKGSSGDNEVRLTIDKADDDDATFMIQYMTGTDDLVKYGNMVYSKSRMGKYGLIQQAVTFDDVTDTGTLAYQGAVWLRQNGKASSTISAEAIDLADIDESVEHFTLGDYVRTKLPGDSAESLFPITAIKIPIAAPENAKLTVGTQESGITSGSGGQGGGSIADAGSGADAMAHTHSNKGVLDKITEQDYADFKGAVNKAHIHANKDTLDKIDETAWLTVYGQSHEHDNKEVLDQITQTEWIAINSAKNKAHTHDNKDTLDKIDDVSWLTVYGQTHEHSNKAVLDKLTAQDYSDFKGTVNKAHVHSNKDTLEKLDMEWWAMWLSAYGNMHTHANKAALDKITDALVTKLSNMDLSKYLPLAGGAMTGDIDLASNGVDLLVGSQRATQTTYATAVAGATISTKQTFSSGLPERKSLVGSFLDQNSVWHSIISVRHRNGYNDGVNYGMYLRSLLTSDGSLIWNKQTGAGKWQGERVLLDSTNYSSYAAKSDHTHAMITNSALWVSGANNTAKWVKLGTLVSSGNFSNAMIRVWSGDGANGRANQNSSFEVQIKDGWQSTESATKACGVTVYRVDCSSVKVKVIPTAHDTYTVWAYMPWGYWNGNYAVYGKYKSWTYQHLIQSEEPEGTGADTAYYDHAFLTSTVANATTWNGLINDVDTYNSSDTWVLVKKDNRIQHRYAGELDVNSAKTLVDSGWQKPTFPSGVKSSSIRYRKQGKIVSVTGYVQFSTAQTTITVFTLPTGYRPPAKIQQFNAVDSSAQASFLTKIDTDGKVGFFGKTRGFFTTATEYYMHCTFFVD